jgi:hypothetical protein
MLPVKPGTREDLIDRGQLLLLRLLGGLLLGHLLLRGLLGLLLRSHGFNSSIVRPGPSDSSPPPKNVNNMNYLHFELQIRLDIEKGPKMAMCKKPPFYKG